MLICTCTLTGTSPISFSRAYEVDKLERESDDKYRDRTWRNHTHRDQNGEAYIPPTALKNALSAVAKYMGEKIKGKGQMTYTKKFQAGIAVSDPIMLGIKADDIPPEKLFLPSDGVAGSGKRVWKIYPTLPSWEAKATIYILDEIISPEKLNDYLVRAGQFIGFGRYRPERNGFYGRFTVSHFKSVSEKGVAA